MVDSKTEEACMFDFQQIIEGSLDTNLILDDRTVVYANEAIVSLLGLENKANIVGKSFDLFLHPDFHPVCKERLHHVREKNGVAPLMEQKMVRLDGTIIDVEIMAIPYHHYNDKKMAQVVIRDITEKKEAQQHMMQTEKLSLIGELASGIVHDIRNPLTSIKGFLQLLKTEISKNNYIDIITTEIQQIEDIANELLYLAKPKETCFKLEPIAEIIHESVALFSSEAFKRKIHIQFVKEKYHHLHILGDKIQLKQVFVNLIKNAIEAIRQAGKIMIELKQDSKHLNILIKDNGVGIPKEHISKIGQSFFTNKTEGTGLGLMMTHTIITNHLGKMTVESEEGVGTVFTIQLPLQEA